MAWLAASAQWLAAQPVGWRGSFNIVAAWLSIKYGVMKAASYQRIEIGVSANGIVANGVSHRQYGNVNENTKMAWRRESSWRRLISMK